LTSSFELLEVFVDEMFFDEIYLLISSTIFTRWNVDLTLTLTLTVTVSLTVRHYIELKVD